MRDNCEACRGERGGVRGNENIVDGRVLCDYCTVEYQDRKARREEAANQSPPPPPAH